MFTDSVKIIFESAVSAVQPRRLLPEYIRCDEQYLFLGEQRFDRLAVHRLVVIAAGKAAASMAKVAEEQAGEIITEGYCITKYDHALPLQHFLTIEAGHPLPDENGVTATNTLLQAVEGLREQDILLVLLSGGASALLADVLPGCTLAASRQLNHLLINCGATIREINTVRKHVSKIKGGQLARAAFPARIFSFFISDVTGDDPGIIASGPTVPDKSSFKEAIEILQTYHLWDLTPACIKEYLSRAVDGMVEETPKPGSSIFDRVTNTVIGSNRIALEAAFRKAAEMGFQPVLSNNALSGDTGQEAKDFIQQLYSYKGKGPVCVIAGGETVVKVTGEGRGGRNQHFALCALKEIVSRSANGELPGITMLCAGTDGTDGPTDAAGAFFNCRDLLPKLVNRNIINDHLERFDAYNFFQQQGGLLKTGPTQTNVMDIVIGIIY